VLALFKNICLALVYIIATLLIPSQIIAQKNSIAAEGNEFRENFRGSILVISHEQILSSTKLGKGIIKKLQESEEILRSEAAKEENYFIAEEQRLTKERDSISVEDFLQLSNDFDRRVEAERQNQRQKEQVIKQSWNKWKRDFYNIYMIPIVERFMKGYGATLVIDIDTPAFQRVIYDSRINITERVISDMNASYLNVEEIVLKITL
tara:strand:+ start:978 stop:1598 length:621 start_codon:yes stop_codon:yes gene_type:complete